jgi:phosphatidylglycerophosphate synthase
MASTSAFGARFDMETDALLVLVIELELWQRGRLGVWILVTGLLRYVYVLAVAVLPRFSREMPRSRLGHYAFAVLLVGLSAALMLPGQAGTLAAAIGTGAVVYSFLYSFYGSYTRSSSEAFGI